MDIPLVWAVGEEHPQGVGSVHVELEQKETFEAIHREAKAHLLAFVGEKQGCLCLHKPMSD